MGFKEMIHKLHYILSCTYTVQWHWCVYSIF